MIRVKLYVFNSYLLICILKSYDVVSVYRIFGREEGDAGWDLIDILIGYYGTCVCYRGSPFF